MEGKENILANVCSFSDVRPIRMELPYPPVQVKGKNRIYANLLSMDHCGSVSELSAIAQYINHENRLSLENCSVAKTLLGIAMAEMIHLQILGEMILLLGGTIDFSVNGRDGKPKRWTAEYLSMPEQAKKMISANMVSENAAIRQYRMHMKMIKDKNINAVLARIIKDEEYHILILQALMKEV